MFKSNGRKMASKIPNWVDIETSRTCDVEGSKVYYTFLCRDCHGTFLLIIKVFLRRTPHPVIVV